MNNQLSTSDLYMAAYILALEFQLVKTEREGRRVYFVFDLEGEDAEKLKQGWFDSTGMVPAQPYAQAIRNLKSLVHET